MNEIDLKDTHIQQHILDDIIPDWRFGIRPSGKLAKSPYLSEQFRPDFSVARPFKNEESEVLCDTDWTQNLVKSGICEKWDGITMRSLSVTGSLVQPNKIKKHYQIECTPLMLINISNPIIVTDELTEKLMAIENQHDAVKNYDGTWKKLRLFFEEYGFLWPEILIIGHKQLTLLEKSAPCEMGNTKFNLLDSPNDSFTCDSIKNWSIIKRKKLKPFYEFLPQFKSFILNVFKHQKPKLKLNTPICWDQEFKLKNVQSRHYLTRHEHTKEEFEPSLCENSPDHNCIWSFQKPTLYHRKLSEVLQGSEDVFLCSPKHQVPDIEHLVLTSKGPEADLREIHHVYFSMDFHEKTNEWILEKKKESNTSQSRTNESFDDAINNFECLLDGDKIMLRQSEVYLSTNESIFDNMRNFTEKLGPHLRELKDDHTLKKKSPKPERHKSLESSKSCILPGKTYNKLCTHSAHRCGSHLMVKKPFLRRHSEYIWRIEVENHQQSQPLDSSDQYDTNTDTSCNSEVHNEPNQLMKSSCQTNIIQSNVDVSSQPDSITAIRSHPDLTSQRLHKTLQTNYYEESVSSSNSEVLNENDTQSITSGPDISDKGQTSSNEQIINKNRYSLLTDAQAYKMRVERHFRKSSDSILYSKSNTQSSSTGTYINEDESIYTQEPSDNKKTSIKTQKKRMELLLRLGKKSLKKNTLVIYLRRATLTSFVPKGSKFSLKKLKSNKSTT